jgi:D-glycero-alpha-D-manno-heptose-7-phosphate kinase
LEFLEIDEPLQISTSADLPANSGLGSSSSFAVALLNGLHALKGRSVSKVQLAEEASFVEIELLNSPIGKQDQYAAAFGGLNHFEFTKGNSVRIEPIYLANSSTEEFLSNSLMLWTGQQRSANTVLSDQGARMSENYLSLVELTKLSSQFRSELIDGTSNWRILAEIMKKGWSLKQKLSDKISTPEVEKIITSLEFNSACMGYKLLGAGGGGFVLAIFENNLNNLSLREQWPSFVPSIDFSGSRIVSVN